MKNMNFIAPVPPDEQKKIAVWYRVSTFFLACIVLIMLIMHARQIQQAMIFNHEYNGLNHTTRHYKNNIDEHQHLTKRYKELASYCQEASCITAQLESPAYWLELLRNTMTPTINLASFSLHEQAFNATIHCPTPASGIVLARSLAQKPNIKSLKIASVQPGKFRTQKTTVITLRGTIN